MAESSSLRSGAGSTFHVDGPCTATAKLRGPSRTVLVRGTMRSPRTITFIQFYFIVHYILTFYRLSLLINISISDVLTAVCLFFL